MHPPPGDDPQTLFTASRFRVVRKSQQTPDGRTHQREIVEHPGSVTILPLLDDDRVCLIRNYRVSVGQTLWELPAGTLEPAEDPLECARRELAEETGYRATRVELLCEFFLSPGILNERMRLYRATGLAPGKAQLDSGEDIETFVVPFSEALAMALDGRIQDAKSLVGILWHATATSGSR